MKYIARLGTAILINDLGCGDFADSDFGLPVTFLDSKVSGMWKPKDKIIEPTSIGALKPIEPLFEFEGEFLTYVAHDPNDELLLVHNLCVSDGVSRYLVSPIDARILEELKAGRLDIYSALRQPQCWIADLVADDSSEQPWRVHALYRIDFDAVPKNHLPRPGAMITVPSILGDLRFEQINHTTDTVK